jgi:hypothetical protein
MEDEFANVVEYLLARPLFLAPILLLAAMMIWAVLKKLLKIAVIIAIAAGLYLAIVQYLGPGF